VQRCVEVKLSSLALKLRLCFNDRSELLSEHYIPSTGRTSSRITPRLEPSHFPVKSRFMTAETAAEFSVTEIEPHPPVDSSVL